MINLSNTAAADPVRMLDQHAARLAAVRAAVGQVILGQDQVIEEALVVILSGGHGLLVGLPGLAKTRLVHTLSRVLGLATRRIQFTPDLMPADILGSEVLDQDTMGQRHFRFIEGPIFCQLLMADEINRASPRTQSALLQAMQEGEVSIAGQTRPLPRPFHVLATQNPIEQEGTYPLPEAQLDRFQFDIRIDYPSLEAERAMLLATTGLEEAEPDPVLDAEALMAAQALVRLMPAPAEVVEAILALVRKLRPQAAPGAIVWGPGPRAAQALLTGARARALLHGRAAPLLADVAALAPAALRHRLALGYAARAEGVSVEGLIAQAVDAVIRDGC